MKNNLAKVEIISGTNTGAIVYLGLGHDEKANMMFVQTCFNEQYDADRAWEKQELRVFKRMGKTKSDRLTPNQRQTVRDAVLDHFGHGLNTDLIGATVINPARAMTIGDF